MKHILILCAAVQLVSAPLAHSADDYKLGADSQPKVYLEIDTYTDVPATSAGKEGRTVWSSSFSTTLNSAHFVTELRTIRA